MATDTLSSMQEVLEKADKLSPLQLNDIKLDVRHTVLTPDYLDNLVRQKQAEEAAGDKETAQPSPTEQ